MVMTVLKAPLRTKAQISSVANADKNHSFASPQDDSGTEASCVCASLSFDFVSTSGNMPAIHPIEIPITAPNDFTSAEERYSITNSHLAFLPHLHMVRGPRSSTLCTGHVKQQPKIICTLCKGIIWTVYGFKTERQWLGNTHTDRVDMVDSRKWDAQNIELLRRCTDDSSGMRPYLNTRARLSMESAMKIPAMSLIKFPNPAQWHSTHFADSVRVCVDHGM